MLPQRVIDRFTDYGAQAKDSQHTADLFPEDNIGQEFAELARCWRLVDEQSRSLRRESA
jgi:hypothetical protein